MESHPRSPRDLFEGRRHYEIPAFQRPYVWDEENQWAPLWNDVVRVAESHLSEGGKAPIPNHFLGAVVYESKKASSGDVTRHLVIDGQQRMTTLQLLLDAAHQVVSERGHDEEAEKLEELILNKASTFRGRVERFKLWPSQADRPAFAHAMDPEEPTVGEHRVVDAHKFFRCEVERWLSGEPDEDEVVPPGTEVLRAGELCSTLEHRLVVVAIDLSGHEDSQLIFETLNDRGTPLLKADLIKNWVFRKGEQVGADVDKWSRVHWSDFDGEWWREELSQGRHIRSRVDIFLQYWLTMRLQEEVKAELVFRVFADYAERELATLDGAEALLKELRNDADTYRRLSELDVGTPEGRFRSRVIGTMELAATTPVLLWLLSENHSVPPDQRRIALDAIESWVIRRTLLRKTAKDVNRFMVAILKSLEGIESYEAGTAIRNFLSEQTAETRYWPSDQEMLTALPELKLYGNIRQLRLRVVLGAVEQQLRDQSDMHEAVGLPRGLEIEHVMPQGWRTHWDSWPKLTPEDAARRDRFVNTIGNLTLVTKSLNGSLSNRPWTDEAATGLTEGGETGKGKRTLLEAFSLLVLNRRLVHNHADGWTEAHIRERSRSIGEAITAVWPGPSREIQDAAYERVRA
ncbi:DUF262 domain-containing HNH endonuclease family protein [Arthrobacter sp. AK04]|uniref:DUF262 domain-containing protein n=1 Tax=Arthrobacter sp. AK04 TaxID=2900048 RepID=UPI001E313931|nr:DUF262 domain-containing protein [Arthrobacter sp. AK04]MCD5341451.1 DUF262 domain-containing HNH endonuclease family protein [Arthrobacter sp. AK04]